MRCGFKIGGGIDQDYHKSPQGYTDNVCFQNPIGCPPSICLSTHKKYCICIISIMNEVFLGHICNRSP